MYERQPDFEADLAEAKDPATDGKRLHELMRKHFGEIEMARTIAGNPSCTQNWFVEFWNYLDRTPEDNPNLETYRSHEDWERVTRQKPRTYFNGWSSGLASGYPYIHRVLYIMKNGDSAYQRHAMGYELLPEYVIREHVASKNAPLRKAIASRETAPDEVFEQLAKDKAKTVRQAVAANAHAPASVIGMLAADKEATVAEAARNNPVCPDEAVHQARLKDAAEPTLADAPVADLKFLELARLAGDAATPPEKLAQLAAHEEDCVRFLAGINPVTPVDMLTQLAQDPTEWVRASAAFNPNTPQAALADLLGSELSDVQRGLASNPSLSEEEQLKLAETACEEAGEALANLTQYPSVWKKLAENVEPVKKNKTWRNYLAEALGARKPGVFNGLERSRDSRYLFVSRIAARSELCSDKLAGHYAHYIFEDYSQNPKAVLALLEGKTHVKAIPYKEWKVDMWLSERAAPGHVTSYYIQSDHAKRRAQSVENWTTQMRYLLPFVLDPDVKTRKRLAVRRDLIRFVFEMLARDEKSTVREAIAKNRQAPKSVLALLVNDKATTVRTEAAKRAPKGSTKRGSNKFANQGSASERARLANSTGNVKLLLEMAGDRAASVRVAVANNYKLPEEELAKLSEDKDAKVRKAVAYRCQDWDILKRLLEDSDKDVRLMAASFRHWRRHSRDHGYYGNQEFLAFLLDAQDAENRAMAAQYIEDQELHEKFMGDADELVHRHLAKNRKLSMDNKFKLARMTEDQETLGELAAKTSNEELFLLAAEKITSTVAQEPIRRNREMMSKPTVQDRLCAHPLAVVRGAVATQRKLTKRARTVLADDPVDWIRKRVASG